MTTLADTLSPLVKGRIVFELTNIHTGERRYVEQDNAITTGLLELIVDWIRGTSPAIPNYIALGTGAATLNDDDTQDAGIDLTSSGEGQQLAQGIQVDSSTVVSSVLLLLKRTGASPGNVYVELQTDSGGSPSGTAVTGGVSSTVSINGIDALEFEWIRFVMPGTPTLAADTQYHIVLKATGYTYSDGAIEVQWGVDESTPGYADGEIKVYDGASWAAPSTAADGCFRVIRKAASNMTDILGEADRNQITSKVEQATTTVRMVSVFTAAEAVGRHNMVGLFNDAAAGTLCAVANVDLEKGSNEVMNIYWIWNFTAG